MNTVNLQSPGAAQRVKKLLSLVACAALLAACGNKPVAPDWALSAEASSERAIQAYLQGQQRVEDLHWGKARSAVASTGQLATAAKLELMRCAAQVASLEWTDCPAYQELAADAGAEQQAYARYLAGQVRAQDVALLPPAQQAVAQILVGATAGDASVSSPSSAALLAAIAAIKEPLSRLVAIGVAARTSPSCAILMQPGKDTASEQGWRRPLMAWLMLQQEAAAQAGAKDTAEKAGKRLKLLNNGTAIPARTSAGLSCKAPPLMD